MAWLLRGMVNRSHMLKSTIVVYSSTTAIWQHSLPLHCNHNLGGKDLLVVKSNAYCSLLVLFAFSKCWIGSYWPLTPSWKSPTVASIYHLFWFSLNFLAFSQSPKVTHFLCSPLNYWALLSVLFSLCICYLLIWSMPIALSITYLLRIPQYISTFQISL